MLIFQLMIFIFFTKELELKISLRKHFPAMDSISIEKVIIPQLFSRQRININRNMFIIRTFPVRESISIEKGQLLENSPLGDQHKKWRLLLEHHPVANR